MCYPFFPVWEGWFSRNGKEKRGVFILFFPGWEEQNRFSQRVWEGSGASQNGKEKKKEEGAPAAPGRCQHGKAVPKRKKKKKGKKGRLRRPEAANGKPFPFWEEKKKKKGGVGACGAREGRTGGMC